MDNEPKIITNDRRLHLDLLRLLAILLVIFNHTGTCGYMLFSVRTRSVMYFPYMGISVLSKIAVPLFFMISGALLLPKEESLKQLLSKRVLRIAVVLVLTSIPYYYWLHRSQGLGIVDLLAYIYGNSATSALWYLYSYLALLLLLPFLRSMVKGMQQTDYLYLFAGYIVFAGVLPCLEYLLWRDTNTLHESLSPVLFVTQNVYFALMGYYIEHAFERTHNQKRNIIMGIMLSIFAVVATCIITHFQIRMEDECTPDQVERFFNCFICIPAMTVYFLMKIAADKVKNERVRRLVAILGSAVFGVYLIEKVLRAIVGDVFTVLFPYVGSFAASWIWSILALGLGLAVVVLIKHIPIIGKIVNKFI